MRPSMLFTITNLLSRGVPSTIASSLQPCIAKCSGSSYTSCQFLRFAMNFKIVIRELHPVDCMVMFSIELNLLMVQRCLSTQTLCFGCNSSYKRHLILEEASLHLVHDVYTISSLR